MEGEEFLNKRPVSVWLNADGNVWNVVEGGPIGNEYSIGKPIPTRHEQTILSATLCRSSGSHFRLRQTDAWRYMRLYTRDSLSVVPILGLDLFQEVQR